LGIDDDERIFKTAYASFKTLATSAKTDADVCEAILVELLTWASPDSRDAEIELALKYGLAFITEVDSNISPDEKQKTPALLMTAKDNKNLRILIARLFKRALDLPSLRTDAAAGLRAWVQAADNSEAYYPGVGHIIAVLALDGNNYECDRQLAYLSRWADPAGNNAAARILATLEKHLSSRR